MMEGTTNPQGRNRIDGIVEIFGSVWDELRKLGPATMLILLLYLSTTYLITNHLTKQEENHTAQITAVIQSHERRQEKSDNLIHTLLLSRGTTAFQTSPRTAEPLVRSP